MGAGIQCLQSLDPHDSVSFLLIQILSQMLPQ